MMKSRLVTLLLLIVGMGSLGGCGASLGGMDEISLAESQSTIASSNTAKVDSNGVLMVAGSKSANAKRKKKARKKSLANKASSSTAYLIGAQDVLDISVFRVPELSKSVQVANTGTINLPLLGEVRAAGQSAQQLERTLTAKLGAKYLRNPQVTVYVKEYNSQRVTVTGAIKKPGVFPIRGQLTLVALVAKAGGLTDSADSTVVVFRDKNGKREAARFDVSAIEAGKVDDPIVQAGDTVVAGHSAIKATFNNILKALPIIGKFALL